MNKRSLREHEISFLFLISLIIVQIFLVFINLYHTQSFPIESFTIVIVELIAILLAYFLGIIPATFFALVYIVGYIFYIITGENNINLITYILLFFVPLSTIYAGNMNRLRKQISNDLIKLDNLEKVQLKRDPYTNLENEIAFKEVISKNSNLAYRYTDYSFSVFMIRLEFIETLKTLLDVREFSNLLEKVASIIQNSIREEDYKFIVSNDRFIIITPMTSCRNVEPAIRRILDGINEIEIKDKNGENIDIVVKVGCKVYSKDEHDSFKDHKKILLDLQKATEVDVYGEYSN